MGTVTALGRVIVPLFLIGIPCAAQYQMIFSAYTDPYIDSNSVLHSAVSVIDESTCYDHYNYATSAMLQSPDNRQASAGPIAGLYADANIPLNNVAGNYMVYVSGTYNCGCSYGAPSSFYMAVSLPIRKTVYSLANYDACGCDYVVNCGSTTATCATGVYSTYHISACGCSSTTWVTAYFFWQGGSACTELLARYNSSNRTCT
jgi:hypothetical protein